MILLDVSFGIFAFLPQGWIFMIFVILIECLFLSKFLERKWKDFKIYKVAALSNVVSGIAGIVISMILNGGWWLVVWFPWVSNSEVDIRNRESLEWIIIFYIGAFILSIIIETLINWIFLRKNYSAKKIFLSTLWVNVISYLVGSAVLYSYSFS